MANERLELVIEVNAQKGNAEIRSVNRTLTGLEQQAAGTARLWGSGMDRMAVDASRAMKRSSQEMYEARSAAMLLGHQIGVQLPQAVTNFLAKSSLLGGVLTSVFKVSVWGAIGIAIYEATKRLWDWAKGSEEAAKRTKELNDEVQKSLETFDKYAANLEKAQRAGALAGLTGTARGQGELGFKREDLAKAQIEMAASQEKYNRLYFESQRRQQAGETPAAAEARRLAAMNEMVVVQDKLREAENKYRVLQIEVGTAQKEMALERQKDYDVYLGKIVEGIDRQRNILTDAEQWAKILDVVSTGWKNVGYGIEDAAEKQAKLLADLAEVQPRMALLTGRPGTDYEKLLEPTDTITKVAQKEMAEAARRTSNQVSTIVTDWSAALARAALDVRNFGSIIVSAARSTAEMLLRMFLEKSLMRSFVGAATTGAAGGGGGGGGGGVGIPGVGGGGSEGSSNLGLGQIGTNLKNFIGFGKGMPASFGGKLSAIGKSDAALMGGIALGAYGLQRGGLSGMAMTTAGGAMIGYRFGGPMGAAIGAGIGFTAGLIRLFIKGATEKARQKVKAIYGVDIKDKGVLKQIVDMAKQGFGGNLDMAIRSQAVRDLVELYAMTTGQGTSGMPAKMTSLSLMQSGGSLYQRGGLPGAGLDRIGAGTAASGPMNLTINLAPEAAQNLLTQGVLKIMGANPRAVQTSATKATKSNFNRRELTSLQLSPGTLTS